MCDRSNTTPNTRETGTFLEIIFDFEQFRPC